MEEWNYYDVDLVRGFFNLKENLVRNKYKKGIIPKKEFLESKTDFIMSFCKKSKIDYKTSLVRHSKIIVSSSWQDFYYYLAFELISFDRYRIKDFLTYQYKNYQGTDDFLDLVPHGVYNQVKNYRKINVERGSLKNGIYILKAHADNKEFVQKLVVQ